MRKRFQKILIYFLTILIVLANFSLLLAPKKASAASISFNLPGQWYLDGTTGKIVNEIEMTKDGRKETVKWVYQSAGGEGDIQCIVIPPGFRDCFRNYRASLYLLADPDKYVRDLDGGGQYYIVVNKESKITLMGALRDPKLEGKDQFYWRGGAGSGDMAFKYATGGSNHELGQYVENISNYILNNQPFVRTTQPSGLTEESKKTCKEYLIEPLGGKKADGTNTNSLWLEGFKKINDRFDEEVIKPISAIEDLELYHMFFKSQDSFDYSDTYIDKVTTRSYQNFVNEFGKSENGLGWFWIDGKATSTDPSSKRDALVSLVGSFALLKYGGLTPVTAAGTIATFATSISVDHYKTNANKDAWQKLARLITALYYIRKHMDYDNCIAQNTTDQSFKDLFAQEQERFKEMVKLVDQQMADFITAEEASRESTCITGGGVLKYASAAWWISQALCAILEFIGQIGQWLIDIFLLSVFNAYHDLPSKISLVPLTTSFLIPKAHAQAKYDAQEGDNLPPLIDAISGKSTRWDWIITVWKFSLGLANLFLVVVLLFLGAVNILHIQYDTYAIKKMLPLLIIGVILANFSLLIMRMLIDASNILTDSFMGNKSPGNMLKELVEAITINDQNPGFFKAWENVGVLLLGVIFAIFGIVAFLILGVMFYIRFAAIVFLGVIAPLAFVAMAFPPTQTVFKQWWSWATKMIFMKPIAFFLLMLALQVKGAEGSTLSITAWIIIVALVYMAILVPWKLGGVVMGLWGGAMGSLFGTKKGGYARKAAEKWWNLKKTDVGTWASKRIPGVGRLIGRWQNIEEDVKNRRESEWARQKRLSNQRARGQYTLSRKEKAAEEALGKTQEAIFLNAFEKGEDTGLSSRMLRKYTGARTKMELKAKYVQIDHDLGEAEAALKKREDIDSSNQAMFAMALHHWLMQQIGDKGATTDHRDGKELNYDNAQTYLSHLRNELLTTPETDEAKKSDIQEHITRVENDINNFEREQTSANSKINFDHYLDRNLYGRMQARVNPRLAEEMDTILKSESIDQILRALEEGGGTAEFRFKGEDVQSYINGDFDKISIPARYGIQSYMMALQAKVGTAGIDQLEAISSMTKLADKAAPGTRAQIIRNAMEGMSTAAKQELKGELGKSIEEITDEDIEGFDMRPGSIQRDFARRLAVAIRSHPALGAAGSPGSYVGRSFAPAPPRAESLMKVNTDPDKFDGDVSRIIDATPGGAEAILRDGETEQTIISLETDVIAKVKPASVQVDDEAVRNEVLQAIRDSGDDLAQLQSQLQTIHPQLRVGIDPDLLPSLKDSAKRALAGKKAFREIAKRRVVEDTMPYFNLRVRQMDDTMLDLAEDEVSTITAKIKQKVANNERISTDPTIGQGLNELLELFGHTKTEREDVVNNLDVNWDKSLDHLERKSRVTAAAKQINQELKQALENARTSGLITDQTREDEIKKFIDNFKSDTARIKKIITEIVGGAPASPALSPPPAQPPTTPTPPAAPPAGPPIPPEGPAGPADIGAQEEQPPEST